MPVKMVDKNGNLMMTVNGLQKRGGDVVMVGNLMGTMPAQIYTSPENAIRLLGILPWSVLLYGPLMLAKGLQSLHGLNDCDFVPDPTSWTHLWSL